MADENEDKVKVESGKNRPKALQSNMKKKALLLGGGIILTLLTAVILTTPSPEKKKAPPAEINIDDENIGKEAWQARAQARIKKARENAQQAQSRSRKIANNLAESRDRSDKLETRIRQMERQLKNMGSGNSGSTNQPQPLPQPSDDGSSESATGDDQPQDESSGGSQTSSDEGDETASNDQNLPPPPPKPAYQVDGDDQTPGTGQSSGQGSDNVVSGGQSGGSGSGSGGSQRSPYIFAPDIPESKKKSADASKQANYEENEYAGYIPAGSFSQGALLTGGDFAASEQTQANPHPVLIRVQDDAITPGGGNYNISSCVVIGSGYGDISSERAYVRLSRLSCMDPSRGLVLETSIQGYIADSDGFQGLRGKVVRRNGQLIAKSILAGFAEGISEVGEAASQAASERLTSPNTGNTGGTGGIQQSQVKLDTGDLAKAGAFGGASNAAGQIAEFYLKEAKNIFPVVSVPPGRKVTLVITQGSALEWSTYKNRYTKQTKPGG